MKPPKTPFLTATLLTFSLCMTGCSSLSGSPSRQTPITNTSSEPSQPSASTPAAMSDAASHQSESTAFKPLDSSIYTPLPFRHPDMIKPQLIKECEDYITLVESYMEDSAFESMENTNVKTISQLLSGHYEVTGRRDKNGREYYIALRRTDAPTYDDFQSLSIGYINTQICQIGYYQETSDEIILYRIPDFLVTVFTEKQGETIFDMLCLIPTSLSNDTVFSYAFDERGRLQLNFVKSHTGLSFHKDGEPCIDFYYQDEDTLDFWSEPYPCCIPLDKEDCSTLISLLDIQKNQDGNGISFESHGKVLDYVRTIDSSIRTTGARFFLDNTTYQLLGSQSSAGYLVSYNESDFEKTNITLFNNQPVFSYIINKVNKAAGQDYGSFTDTWFELPLVKASLDFPQLETKEDDSISLITKSQTIVEPEKLTLLSKLLSEAIHGHEALSGCPYTGILTLTREDGETLQMFVATDSCDSITYEGRIGFEYGSQKELSNIFDKAIPSWK